MFVNCSSGFPTLTLVAKAISTLDSALVKRDSLYSPVCLSNLEGNSLSFALEHHTNQLKKAGEEASPTPPFTDGTSEGSRSLTSHPAPGHHCFTKEWLGVPGSREGL